MERRTRPPPAPNWLNDVYSLVTSDKSDAAIDLLFQRLDDLLRAERFDAADEVLGAVDVSRLNASLLVAVLAITRPVREKLSERAALLERIERRLGDIEADRCECLLRRVR